MKKQQRNREYHVALNTKENEFIVYDSCDASIYATGVTIEEAIKNYTHLKNLTH
ncbi:hypothetical protein [Enterococcus gilvus]|uniref:hypothetical protein n=1 Tax=Enterococcus gilvus TaxID=160453 RepID=UPI0029092C5F|nr:hypothetical protein [Enterococcus gilvus]MDU5509136.1 hypothetical protein [Enterococcus gilvus]